METVPKKRSYGLRVVLITLAIVIAFLYFWGASLNTPTSGGMASTQTTQYVPDEIDLHIQAQQFILQALKAPSTAKFPALPYSATTDSNGLYRVISYVDSQNSFGAMIRDDWSVTMRLVNEKWILEKLIIGDKMIYDATSGN